MAQSAMFGVLPMRPPDGCEVEPEDELNPTDERKRREIWDRLNAQMLPGFDEPEATAGWRRQVEAARAMARRAR